MGDRRSTSSSDVMLREAAAAARRDPRADVRRAASRRDVIPRPADDIARRPVPVPAPEPVPTPGEEFPGGDAPRRRGWLARATRFAWIGVGLAVFVGVSLVESAGTPIDALAVGDCFHEPAVFEYVTAVDTVDCAATHDFEVFAAFEHEAGTGLAFPGDAALIDWSEPLCSSAFQPYVGVAYESSVYYYDIAIPTAAGWEDGDRGALCLIFESFDGVSVDPTAGSARDSAQ